MTEAEFQTTRYAFSLLAIATGVVGTCCQVLSAWLNQLGGPRESHVAAVLVGMGGAKDQDIFIADRRLVPIVATTLSSYGAALLFAALIAGLVVNFPALWSTGLWGWAIVVL